MIPWLFLAASLWGALFTTVAIWPPRRPWQVIGLTFFPAWLTTELALHHLLWQVIAVAVFVWLGALDVAIGWVALAVTALSWVGLVRLLQSANLDQAVVAAALAEGLGRGPTERVHAPFRWLPVLLPFQLLPRGLERIANVPYVEGAGRRQSLDIVRRREMRPDEGAPVVLQIHGGAWVVGDKAQQGRPLMQHLAAMGWVCVSINYRLSPRATWPDQLVDCKRALAWVREHIAEYGGDARCVVVTGGSAGGHLTALMALTANDPRWQPGFEHADTSVQAFVPFYGVYDWTDRNGFRGRGDPMRSLLALAVVKRRFREAQAIYEQASPLSHVGPHAPPAMVVHGGKDTLAPASEARAFVEALRARSNGPVIYLELPGAHHAFEVFASVRTLHVIDGVAAFFAWVRTLPREPREQRDQAGAAGPSFNATL